VIVRRAPDAPLVPLTEGVPPLSFPNAARRGKYIASYLVIAAVRLTRQGRTAAS